MAEPEPNEQPFYEQFLRSRTADGTEVVRRVVRPELLDQDAAAQLETAAGREFRGFVDPELVQRLGTELAPPAPPAAEVPQAEAPRGMLARAADVVFPERSFASQVPSIAGAVAGGLTGARYGGMVGGVPGAIAGGLGGAAAGGFGGEAGQVLGEEVAGASPAEAGTLLVRGGRAAVRGAVGEATGQAAAGALRLAATPARRLLGAVESLAPVLRQDLPAGTTVVRSAGGQLRRVDRVLGDADALARFKAGPGEQETLLRAWWQQKASAGPTAVVMGWEALGEAGQAALAGEQRAAMQTIVDTLRRASEPFDLTALAQRGGWPAAVGGMFGGPTGAAIGGALPAAAEAARVAGPRLIGPQLLAPGAGWLGTLPPVVRVASPAVAFTARAAPQAAMGALRSAAPPEYAYGLEIDEYGNPVRQSASEALGIGPFP